jgi:hypothetical protein
VFYCLRQWVWIVLPSRAFGGRRMKTLPAVAALLIGHAVVGAEYGAHGSPAKKASYSGKTRPMLPGFAAFIEEG